MPEQKDQCVIEMLKPPAMLGRIEYTAKVERIGICWLSERKISIDDTRQAPGTGKQME